MKKIFTCIAAVLAALAISSCSKSSNDYEAIYYILLTGSNNVITNNDEDNHYKTMIETQLAGWTQATNMTWRVNFGKSYSDADVAAKDAEAVVYFNQRVDALKDIKNAIVKDMNDNGSPAIVHVTWHLTVCRDRSNNVLTTAADVYLDHE